MRLLTLTTALFMAASTANAQDVIPLYPDAKGLKVGGRDKLESPPQLIHHPAGAGTGKPCVLICPGGGYTGLAQGHEGRDVAAFYNAKGFEAFILLYRLNDKEQGGSRFPAQLQDVSTAMRIIRSRSAEFGIDPGKTGILGFSAGGHLASMGATLFSDADSSSKDPLARFDSRPSFAILIYPVISMADSFAHKGSVEMLLGKGAEKSMRDSLSTYNRVTERTPPTFIVFSGDDRVVPPQNGIVFYQALLRNKVKANLHIFDHGGHGYGMAPKDPVLNQWPEMSVRWLASLGIR